MSAKSREQELNSRLTECFQIHKRLSDAGFDLSTMDLSSIPEERRRYFVTAFYNLLDAIDKVAHLLKEISLDSVIHNVAPQPLQLYREKLIPNRDNIARLFIGLLGFPNVELDQREFPPDTTGNPVWNILSSGLDFWEGDDSGLFSDNNIEDTSRLIYSSFFRPDEWLRNADDLQPVLGAGAEQRIPSNVRIRLKELFRSYILGNHLSVIALSRAILEYALVDRAAKIGINPLSDDPNYPNRTRKLSLLVDDASERRPDLRLAMESIVEAGNMTLHPKKKDNLVLLPGVLKDYAFTSLNAVRRVIENLYMDM